MSATASLTEDLRLIASTSASRWPAVSSPSCSTSAWKSLASTMVLPAANQLQGTSHYFMSEQSQRRGACFNAPRPLALLGHQRQRHHHQTPTADPTISAISAGLSGNRTSVQRDAFWETVKGKEVRWLLKVIEVVPGWISGYYVRGLASPTLSVSCQLEG